MPEGYNIQVQRLQDRPDQRHTYLQLTGCSWVRNLGAAFRERGVSVLDDRFLPINDDIAHPWTLNHLMSSVESISIIDQPRGNASAREWWKLYDRAAAEVKQGATMRMGMVSVVGHKTIQD